MKYYTSVNSAIQAYTNHVDRLGYPDGYFTKLRHSFKFRQEHQSLLGAVNGFASEHQAKSYIQHFIQRARQHHHSFSSYLIDQLEIDYPDENWQEYRQRDNKVVLHQGIVYRGLVHSNNDSQNYKFMQRVFSEGLCHQKLQKGKSIGEYIAHGTDATGHSCSKHEYIAQRYASKTFYIGESPAGSFGGVVFKIDTRGLKIPIDIVQTMNFREFSIFSTSEKAEVNILDLEIPKENI